MMVASNLVENDLNLLKEVTKFNVNADGYMCGKVRAGFACNSALLLGSPSHLLHYNFTAITENTNVLYLSRDAFETAL